MRMKQYEPDGIRYQGAMGGIIWTPDIADEIFDTWDYGHAFAYLYRRFGPPHLGSDPHTELVSYWLTTKMKGVLLTIRPAHSAGTSFGYLLSSQIYYKIQTEDIHAMWLRRKGRDFRTPRKNRIERALKRAMEELKRPTNIRDWLINIQGDVEPDYPKKYVEPSNLAGYGISRDYFDKFKEFPK